MSRVVPLSHCAATIALLLAGVACLRGGGRGGGFGGGLGDIGGVLGGVWGGWVTLEGFWGFWGGHG